MVLPGVRGLDHAHMVMVGNGWHAQVGFNQNMQGIIHDASVDNPSCTICDKCYTNPDGQLEVHLSRCVSSCTVRASSQWVPVVTCVLFAGLQ